MTDQKERAQAIKEITRTRGWLYVEEMIEERIREHTDALLHMMDSKPDTLTGKAAIRHASKRKALKDFIEDLKDEVRLNAPDPA